MISGKSAWFLENYACIYIERERARERLYAFDLIVFIFVLYSYIDLGFAILNPGRLGRNKWKITMWALAEGC